MEIPKNKPMTKWLFADNLKREHTMEFVEFKEVDSKKGNKIPCFVLLGSDDESSGEFVLSTWNVANLEQLTETLGSDDENWKTKTFKCNGLDDGKIELILI